MLSHIEVRGLSVRHHINMYVDIFFFLGGERAEVHLHLFKHNFMSIIIGIKHFVK